MKGLYLMNTIVLLLILALASKCKTLDEFITTLKAIIPEKRLEEYEKGTKKD